MGRGGSHAPCSSQPSRDVDHHRVVLRSALSPNSTAIRATTVAGVSNSSRKIFSRQSTTLDRSISIGASVRSYGLGLVAALQHGAAQPEAAVGGDRRQPGRHRQREILQHELAASARSAASVGSANRSTICLSGSRE